MQDEKFMQVFKHKIIEVPKLFEGFEQFKKDHSNSTLSSYNLAYNHFLNCCGNIKISTYTKDHGNSYSNYLSKKGLRVNSIHTYTKHMHIIWNKYAIFFLNPIFDYVRLQK